MECKAHGSLPIGGPSILVLLNDQLLGQVEEGVVHARAHLRTGFDHRDIGVSLLELLYILICYLDVLFLLVALICEHHHLYVASRVFVYLLQPGINT